MYLIKTTTLVEVWSTTFLPDEERKHTTYVPYIRNLLSKHMSDDINLFLYKVEWNGKVDIYRLYEQSH